MGRGPGHLPAGDPAPSLAAAELVPGHAPPAPRPPPSLFSVKLPAPRPPQPPLLLRSSSLVGWPRFRSPCSFRPCPPCLSFLVCFRLRPSLISGVLCPSLCLAPSSPIPSAVPSSFSLRFFVSVCDIVAFPYFCTHSSLFSVTVSFLSLSPAPPFPVSLWTPPHALLLHLPFLPHCLLVSPVRLFVIPGTVARKAPLSMKFSRQEYWSGWPFPSPGDLPDLGIELASPALQADSFTI